MEINKNVCTLHVLYTEGLRKLRRAFVIFRVVIVSKMSGWRRDEDNWRSTDPACCWSGRRQWVCLCAADSSVLCRQMRSSDWKDLCGLIAYWRTSVCVLTFCYFMLERSKCKCRSFLVIFPWGAKFLRKCNRIFLLLYRAFHNVFRDYKKKVIIGKP